MEPSINIYNQFVDSVKNLTQNDMSSYNINVEERLNKYYDALQNDDLFSLFSINKIKVFSAKTVETHILSTSLFGEELSLKQIFNNQPDSVKNELWDLLFNLYIQLEKVNKNDTTRISILKDQMKKNRNANSTNIKSDLLKNVLNADVNATTNNMLDDIINSFQNVVSNKGNPFENIMGITEMITTKYGSKIENGEVEIDKILGGMGGLLGNGMGLNKQEDAPVIIDENFSTSNIDVGKEEEGPQINLSKLMPLADMVTKINSVQTEDDILSLKKEMDSFMEKELKVDMTQYKENMEKIERKLENIKLENKIVEEVD